MHRFAVIIPFYQEDPGILRRALLGVLSQDLPPNSSAHVFVVDDSSPLPPESDLVDLPVREDVTISVHRQVNGGPGAARNRGLDMAQAQGFDFIAFLDSDDFWHPAHLADAMKAFESEAELYFCDHDRDDGETSYSESVRPKMAKSDLLPRNQDVTYVSGEKLIPEMIANYLSHTSCVVVKASLLGNLRFDPELRAAGEDHMLWIQLTMKASIVAISAARNVTCGRGVSIYFSAFSWDSPKSLDRVAHRLLFACKLGQMTEVMKLQPEIIVSDRTRYRRGYAFLFMRALLRGKKPRLDTLRKVARRDRTFPLLMPFLLVGVLARGDAATSEW